MFNKSRALQEGKNIGEHDSRGDEVVGGVRVRSVVEPSNGRGRNFKHRKKRNKVRISHNKTLHCSNSNRMRSFNRTSNDNFKKRMKSPHKRMKVLGLYSKSSLLEDVLKMYKTTSVEHQNTVPQEENVYNSSSFKEEKINYVISQNSGTGEIGIDQKGLKNPSI